MTCEIGRSPSACTSANSSTDRSEVKKLDVALPISPSRCCARSGSPPRVSASSDAACSVCARARASRSSSLPRRKNGIRVLALDEQLERKPRLFARLGFACKVAQKRVDPRVERDDRALQHDPPHCRRTPRFHCAVPRREEVTRLAEVELDGRHVFLLREQPP